MRDFFRRSFIYIIGLILLSLGISLTIKADLGTGAWDALNVGLQVSFGLTIGTWVIIVGSILIFVNSMLFRRRPTLTSIFNILLVGVFVDFWILIVFENFHHHSNLGTQILLLLLGAICLPLGIATYLQANLAPNPIDQLMLAIQYRFHLNLMLAKTIGEIIALILAWLLNGPIGIGTIILTFAIGPLVQFFIPFTKKTAQKFLDVRQVQQV